MMLVFVLQFGKTSFLIDVMNVSEPAFEDFQILVSLALANNFEY